jgi:hypothetical protein
MSTESTSVADLRAEIIREFQHKEFFFLSEESRAAAMRVLVMLAEHADRVKFIADMDATHVGDTGIAVMVSEKLASVVLGIPSLSFCVRVNGRLDWGMTADPRKLIDPLETYLARTEGLVKLCLLIKDKKLNGRYRLVLG